MKKTLFTILTCLLFALPAMAQDGAGMAGTESTEESHTTEDAAETGQDEAKKELQEKAYAIQETFAQYRQAVVDKKADEIPSLVTQGTLDYFAQVQELALYATADELEKRSLTDRMQVVVLRHRIPLSTLQSKSPVELLKYCVETGLLGQTVSAVELGEIRLKEDKAEVQPVIQGQPLPVILRFVQEDGTWKIDMLSILSAGNDMLRNVAEQQGMTQDDLILQLVAKGSGMEVSKDIWEPPLTRDDGATSDGSEG